MLSRAASCRRLDQAVPATLEIEDKRLKGHADQVDNTLRRLDTSILHHAFISIFIALWDVITHYVTILMPFLSYFTRFTQRGRMLAAGNLDQKEANLIYLLCTTPKVLKFYKELFWNKKILGEESTRGDPPGSHKGGGRALPS